MDEEEDDDRPEEFSCGYCGTVFSSIEELYQHLSLYGDIDDIASIE